LKEILLVDNYDSFTFNLLHSLEKNEGVIVTVVRNDNLLNIDLNKFDKIVLSPGPGLPSEAGQLLTFIKKCYLNKSILGICLGHQAIGQFFGAKLKNLSKVLHGVKLETTVIDATGIFESLPEIIETGHYHSWVLSENDFPIDLSITAHNAQGGIMAFAHNTLNIVGIQFHPESVLTPLGDLMIANWLKQ
jgi:anthranilate synthase component 2